MVSYKPATFHNWKDASTYRTVAASYHKDEVDTALGLKADSSAVYSKAEVDTAIGAKADSADLSTLQTTVGNLEGAVQS